MKGIKGFEKGNKLGKANQGRIRGALSESQKEDLRIIAKKRKELLGYVISPETRKKMVESRIKNGYGHSVETRRKMSLAKKGKPKKPFTEEHKKNISKGKMGKSNFKIKGDKCWLWKGGISPENRKIRNSLEMKIWRRAVFERDNFMCIWGGKEHGNELQADHIKPFYLYPELRFAIDNGRTLCKKCHLTTETWGRPKNI